MKVFINPGHCPGKDPGAVGFGITEADKVLSIGKKVESYLKAAGVETKLLQSDSLEGICAAANDWNADYFVSIHCNAANTIARGTETYCYRNSKTGRKLASAIHTRIKTFLPALLDRGVKEAGFVVLKYTNCPAALVETAFIDNASDNNLLQTCEDEFARAIACGITDFLLIAAPDVVDKPSKNVCPTCGREL